MSGSKSLKAATQVLFIQIGKDAQPQPQMNETWSTLKQ
jgi:hypothetical protein